MRTTRIICRFAIVLAAGLISVDTTAQGQAEPIADSKITALGEKLTEAVQSSSSARKRLAVKRVIREGESLYEKHQAALNRFEVLGVLFRSQQQLVRLEDSTTNRRALPRRPGDDQLPT